MLLVSPRKGLVYSVIVSSPLSGTARVCVCLSRLLAKGLFPHCNYFNCVQFFSHCLFFSSTYHHQKHYSARCLLTCIGSWRTITMLFFLKSFQNKVSFSLCRATQQPAMLAMSARIQRFSVVFLGKWRSVMWCKQTSNEPFSGNSEVARRARGIAGGGAPSALGAASGPNGVPSGSD